MFNPNSSFDFQITPNIRYGEITKGEESRRFVSGHQCETAMVICNFLEIVRFEFNGPVIITSGYRPPKINASVGGARQSEHLYDAPDTGAVDFYVRGVDIYAVEDFCHKRWPYSVGFGAPRGFVHLGMRPGKPNVSWDY